jgi:hypothetical protein
MNVEIGSESCAVTFLGIHKLDLVCSVIESGYTTLVLTFKFSKIPLRFPVVQRDSECPGLGGWGSGTAKRILSDLDRETFGTLIKKKRKFSSNIRIFRWDWVQIHI